jgi:hypothetical protein
MKTPKPGKSVGGSGKEKRRRPDVPMHPRTKRMILGAVVALLASGAWLSVLHLIYLNKNCSRDFALRSASHIVAPSAPAVAPSFPPPLPLYYMFVLFEFLVILMIIIEFPLFFASRP